MKNEKAINVILELIKGAGLSGDDTTIDALDMAYKALVVNGCFDCMHKDIDPWGYPCYDCSRNHKDYFTAK